jgi:Primase C terminal 1 (PriCT-1)
MRQFVYDYEAQPIIAAQTNNFSRDFLYKNHSDGYDLKQLHDHFINCFPFDKILCGYKKNSGKEFVRQAVRKRFINFRAKPFGWDALHETWNKNYPVPPIFMAFDVDEDKQTSPYNLLFPDYRCYEIHDAMDIARPLVTTINPISGNCQYVYSILWTDEDLERFMEHPDSVLREFEAIRKELSWLFGADRGFTNHVIRSPLYIAGHHKDDPERRTNTRYKFEVGAEALYHHSIWYNPDCYTLDDLRQLASELKELHVRFLSNEERLEQLRSQYFPSLSSAVEHTRASRRFAVHEPRITRAQALAINPRTVEVGERNDAVFNYLKFKGGYPHARKFKPSSDINGFESFLTPFAQEFNSQIPTPLPESDIRTIVRSVAKWCSSDRFMGGGRTSEEARFINFHYRWKNHTSAAQEAIEQNVSKETIYRRRKSKYTIPPDRDLVTNSDSSRPKRGNPHFVKTYTPELVKQVIPFQSNGMTQRAIASELGISIGKVQRILRDAPTPEPKRLSAVAGSCLAVLA